MALIALPKELSLRMFCTYYIMGFVLEFAFIIPLLFDFTSYPLGPHGARLSGAALIALPLMPITNLILYPFLASRFLPLVAIFAAFAVSFKRLNKSRLKTILVILLLVPILETAFITSTPLNCELSGFGKECWKIKAGQERNPEYCERIVYDKFWRNYCLDSVAKTTGNREACDMIPEGDWEHMDCLHALGYECEVGGTSASREGCRAVRAEQEQNT